MHTDQYAVSHWTLVLQQEVLFNYLSCWFSRSTWVIEPATERIMLLQYHQIFTIL